jgi:hypothetical protein
LPDALELISRALRAGHSLAAGFGLVGGLTGAIGAAIWVLLAFPGGRDDWRINVVLGALLLAAGALMVVFGRRSEHAFRERMEAEVAALPRSGSD